MCVCAYLTTTCFNENASAAIVTSKQEINSGSGLLSKTTISAQEKTWIGAGSKHLLCVSASLAADNTDNKSESQFFNKKCTYKINGLFNNDVRLFCLINQNFSWCSVLSNFHKFICVCIVQTLASFQQRKWCVHICKKSQYVWYYTYNISCWIFWTHSCVTVQYPEVLLFMSKLGGRNFHVSMNEKNSCTASETKCLEKRLASKKNEQKSWVQTERIRKIRASNPIWLRKKNWDHFFGQKSYFNKNKIKK